MTVVSTLHFPTKTQMVNPADNVWGVEASQWFHFGLLLESQTNMHGKSNGLFTGSHFSSLMLHTVGDDVRNEAGDLLSPFSASGTETPGGDVDFVWPSALGTYGDVIWSIKWELHLPANFRSVYLVIQTHGQLAVNDDWTSCGFAIRPFTLSTDTDRVLTGLDGYSAIPAQQPIVFTA